MQNKVNLQREAGKKWCHFLNSPLSRIYMRNSAVKNEIKSVERRPPPENTMPVMFEYTSGWVKMSRSSQKHCGYQNSSGLQQKSSHLKYQYSGSEKLEANQRLVLLYDFTNISSCQYTQRKQYFHVLLIKGVVLSLAFYGLSSSTGKKPLCFLISIPGKLYIEATA